MIDFRIQHYITRALQELSFLSRISIAKPTSVIVIMTNSCNARCLHCHSYKLGKNPRELTAKGWANVFGELRQWLGPVFLTLTGGEPLVRKDALPIVEHATRNGFCVEFLTNGNAVNSAIAERLIRSGVKRVTISMDGSSPDVQDKIRGRVGFHEKARNAVRMLVEQNRIQGGDTVVRIKTAIMSLNLNDIVNIPPLAKELGAEGVLYQALEPVYYSGQFQDENWFESNYLWIKDLAALDVAVDKIKSLKADGLSRNVRTQQYKRKTKKCRSWLGLQIMPDGGMKMCHPMEPFAYALDGGLARSWESRSPCWENRCEILERYF
jgi:MoaA/NifB/PqqE/SkfB family radical SAM enzyme